MLHYVKIRCNSLTKIYFNFREMSVKIVKL